MKIAFLTSSHLPKDDRIFYHQAISLARENNKILIVSSKENKIGEEQSIAFNCFSDKGIGSQEKIGKMLENLQVFSPDTIICSEPLTVITANKYKHLSKKRVNVIYDITEWYPSKKNLTPYSWFTVGIHFFKFLFLNVIAARKVDAFIFGEYYKSIPFRKMFSKKKFIFTTYYPDLTLIKHNKPSLTENYLRLSYSGKLSKEKGFENFLLVASEVAKQKPSLQIKLKIIGWYSDQNEKQYFSQIIKNLSPRIEVEEFGIQSLEDFISLVSDTDIFLDLRSDDYENQHCLAIKLFYYAALERPVIYSDLKAIRKEVEIDKFGYLFKPNEYQKIASQIVHYIENKEHYYSHCQKARLLAETKYNWEKIRTKFVNFVETL